MVVWALGPAGVVGADGFDDVVMLDEGSGCRRPSFRCDSIGCMTPDEFLRTFDEHGSAAIEAEVASAAVDDFLHRVLNHGHGEVGGSVHIHCTDVAGEWTIRQSGDGFVVVREHAKGDCAIRGAASDILLVLWRRTSLSTVDVVGDADVAARFVAVSALP
jgi:hypothetical protein